MISLKTSNTTLTDVAFTHYQAQKVNLGKCKVCKRAVGVYASITLFSIRDVNIRGLGIFCRSSGYQG